MLSSLFAQKGITFAMSPAHRIQYIRDPQQQSPFPKKPSGSNWEGEHLKWLGVDLEHNCALLDIVSPRLLPACKIVQYLRRQLDLPWGDILSPRLVFSQVSVYSAFRLLSSVPGPTEEYEKSSPIKAVSPPQYRSISQLAMDTKSALVPPRITDFSPSTKASGSSYQHSAQRNPQTPPRLLRPSRHAVITQSSSSPSSLSYPSPDCRSDSTYEPTLSSPSVAAVSPASILEDKAEENVKIAGLKFCNVVVDALLSAAPMLDVSNKFVADQTYER